MNTTFPIIQQGTIISSGNTIYSPHTLYGGIITNIKITNIVGAYVISLYRYIKTLGARMLLYKLSLDLGDIVNDDTEYRIKSGDYLYLESDVANTIYAVSGIESVESN